MINNTAKHNHICIFYYKYIIVSRYYYYYVLFIFYSITIKYNIENKIEIDVTNLNSGIYIYKLNGRSNKFIKE